jgi:hypothetical protein
MYARGIDESGVAVEPLLDPNCSAPDRCHSHTWRVGGMQTHHLARRGDCRVVAGGKSGDRVSRSAADLGVGQSQLGHDGVRRG